MIDVPSDRYDKGFHRRTSNGPASRDVYICIAPIQPHSGPHPGTAAETPPRRSWEVERDHRVQRALSAQDRRRKPDRRRRHSSSRQTYPDHRSIVSVDVVPADIGRNYVAYACLVLLRKDGSRQRSRERARSVSMTIGLTPYRHTL